MPAVLIVEDDEGIREMMRLGLELEGFDVSTAIHGKDALDVLSRLSRQPGLILLDLMMPVMNGWQFLECKKKDPKISSIPVVIVSAFAERATDIEFQGLLKKPFSLEELTQVARKHCREHS